MNYLTKDDVIKLNSVCLKEGENSILIKEDMLESALGNQYAPYELEEQNISSTYRSLILNHPFENGNKRTAFLSLFYMSKDKKIKASEDEIIDLTLTIAKENGGSISVNKITNILFKLELEESLEEAKEKIRYYYNGPVMDFYGKVLRNPWQGYKEAVSEKQAFLVAHREVGMGDYLLRANHNLPFLSVF